MKRELRSSKINRKRKRKNRCSFLHLFFLRKALLVCFVAMGDFGSKNALLCIDYFMSELLEEACT